MCSVKEVAFCLQSPLDIIPPSPPCDIKGVITLVFITAHMYSFRVRFLLQMVPLLKLPQLEPPKERVIICLSLLFAAKNT